MVADARLGRPRPGRSPAAGLAPEPAAAPVGAGPSGAAISSGALRSTVRSTIARLVGFPLTAVAQLLTSRLIISHYGLQVFSGFALMLVLIALLPANTRGIGAAVTSSWAEAGPDAPRTQRVMLTATRSLLLSTIGLSLVAAVLALAGLWPRIIGDAAGSNGFIAAGVIIFLISFVPGLAPNILLAAHRNHVTVLVQNFTAPVTLVWVLLAIWLALGGGWVILAPAIAILTIQLITAWLARGDGVRWLALFRKVPDRRRYPGESIRSLSGWMFVSSLALPIALQSDRIVLSHVSTVRAVANYTIAFQIFAPVTALIIAGTAPLWPIYARAKAEGHRSPNLVWLTALFTIGSAAICAVLVVLADPIGRAIGGPADIDLGILLPIAGALVVVAQALVSPLAMMLIDPRGVRAVAVANVIALPVNLALSIVLARKYGAAGPLLATALVGVTMQVFPLAWYARNRRLEGRHRRAGRPPEEHSVDL